MSLKKFICYLALLPILFFPLQSYAEEITVEEKPADELPVTEKPDEEKPVTTDETKSERIEVLDKLLLKDPAKEAEAEKMPEPVEPPEEESPFFSFLDRHQKAVTSRLERYVQGVDNFFTDESALYESSGSYMRVRLESFWTEGEGAELKGGLSFKLRLPKIQKKLKLTISSEVDEQKTTEERETGAVSERDETNRGLYTGLEKILGKETGWSFKPSIGVKIRSPLDTYVRLRASRQVTFDNWLMNFSETLYWFDSTGSGSDTSMRWDRKLGENFLFRSDSFLRYTDLNDYFDTSQSFGITHTISKKRAITYKIAAFGIFDDETTYATSYIVDAYYRQNIHKDYLFLDIQPLLRFDRENDFKGEPGLFVRLELFYR